MDCLADGGGEVDCLAEDLENIFHMHAQHLE